MAAPPRRPACGAAPRGGDLHLGGTAGPPAGPGLLVPARLPPHVGRGVAGGGAGPPARGGAPLADGRRCAAPGAGGPRLGPG
eukprot:9758578-Alexandrium_andersonii.AAC.1